MINLQITLEGLTLLCSDIAFYQTLSLMHTSQDPSKYDLFHGYHDYKFVSYNVYYRTLGFINYQIIIY